MSSLMQTHTDYLHPTTQSDPDSQTALPQARNISSGCNAVLFLYQSIGFAIWTADAHPFKPARPFSDDPMWYIRRTITDCRGCRSALSGCRFGRSGSGSCGFVGSFRSLRWCSLDRRNRLRAYHNALRRDWRFRTGYGLLFWMGYFFYSPIFFRNNYMEITT